MAAVTLVKDGEQKVVQTGRAFTRYVYGDGWLPVTGSVAQAWETLTDGAPMGQGLLSLEQRFTFGPTKPTNPQPGSIHFVTVA